VRLGDFSPTPSSRLSPVTKRIGRDGSESLGKRFNFPPFFLSFFPLSPSGLLGSLFCLLFTLLPYNTCATVYTTSLNLVNTVGSLGKKKSPPPPVTENCVMAARENVSVGIVGMGDMGKMYARVIAAAGWRFVTHSFLPFFTHSFWVVLKTELEVSMLATGKTSSKA